MSSAATIAISAEPSFGPVHALSHELDSQTNTHTSAKVFVVNGNSYVRQSLEFLTCTQGWQLQFCESAQEFLAESRQFVASALILAFPSKDSNGLEAQKRIARECAETPIIVVADYEDVPTAVQAMKAGAVDFLVKPFSDEQLAAAIRRSIVRSRAILDRETEMRDLRRCYASLTPRERQVMALVVSGLLDKQVGAKLCISEITVKAHRGQVMQKMKAGSFAQLVNMASRLRLTR